MASLGDRSPESNCIPNAAVPNVEPVSLIEIIDATDSNSLVSADAETVELEVSRVQMVGVLVLAAIAALLLLGVDRPVEQAIPNVPSTVGTGELSNKPRTSRYQPSSTGLDATVTDVGPLSTTNRDPSYVGRPGNDEPVRNHLVDKTLLYVNEFGRPTIVDLTTGDQREVLIAEERSQDRFELEFGQIVTSEPTRSDLPLSMGRSFVVTGMKAGAEADPEGSIVICIDGPGCRGETTLASSEVLILSSGGADSATQLPTLRGAQDAIAQLLGFEDWSIDHRWTLFGANPAGSDVALKIPTPHPEAAVWLIEQAR